MHERKEKKTNILGTRNKRSPVELGIHRTDFLGVEFRLFHHNLRRLDLQREVIWCAASLVAHQKIMSQQTHRVKKSKKKKSDQKEKNQSFTRKNKMQFEFSFCSFLLQNNPFFLMFLSQCLWTRSAQQSPPKHQKTKKKTSPTILKECFCFSFFQIPISQNFISPNIKNLYVWQ